MSRKHHAHSRPTATTKHQPNWRFARLAVAGLAALVGGILVVQTMTPREGSDATAAASLHTKGAATAAVTLVEWGDFQ